MRSERDLILGCQRQDPASQEALYRRFWSLAMSVALRYTPCRDDAVELANDGFLKAFGGIGSVDPGRPFGPWFRQVVVRCAIDRHRSTRRYHATIQPLADPPEDAVAADQASRLEAAELLTLLAALDPTPRAVFNLYEVEGYAHDEIAEMLQIAPGTSRSHLARAKKQLRAMVHQLTEVHP